MLTKYSIRHLLFNPLNYITKTHRYSIIMNITKVIKSRGNDQDYPKKGDMVTVTYVGKLEDGSVYGANFLSLTTIANTTQKDSTLPTNAAHLLSRLESDLSSQVCRSRTVDIITNAFRLG